MNILRIIYDWPPPWIGLSPQPYELTVSQAKKANNMTVMCGRWPKSGELVVPDKVNVIPIWRAPFQGALFFTSSVLLFLKYLRWRRKHKPDLIHMHGHFGIWILLYRYFLFKVFPWSKELDIVLVGHFHNTAQGRWDKATQENKEIKTMSRKIEWPLMVLADKLICQLASACIFVSEDLKSEAIKYYTVDTSKCFVVESGVNIDLFQPVKPEEYDKTRRDLGFDPYDKVLLYYGFIVERKNVHLLVEALKYLPQEYKLMLLGTSDASYMEKLNEIIIKNHLEHRILKMGYTPYPQIPVAIQAANIVILPSSYEGMPKVVTESLACGKPVLASGFKMKRDIKGLFYLDKLDAKSIADKVHEVLSSVESSKVDLATIQLYYSWDKKVEEIEIAYKYAFTHKVR